MYGAKWTVWHECSYQQMCVYNQWKWAYDVYGREIRYMSLMNSDINKNENLIKLLCL